jgi:hypothetical protein
MYIPRHWHWAFPISVILVGVYLRQKYGEDWTTFLAQLGLVSLAVYHGLYILVAGAIYQIYITGIDNRSGNKTPVITPINDPKKYTDLNNASEVYSQNIQRLKWDATRHFAFTVCNQHEHKFSRGVVMTEAFWLESKPRRFKGSPEEFRQMKHDFEMAGIIARENGNKNSTHVLIDPLAMRLVADGNPIPNPLPH